MQSATTLRQPLTEISTNDSNHSGVSWGAVIAGAAGAAVLSLLLFILGFGLGLSSLSPWRNEGAEGSTFGWVAVAWVAFTQIAASALGGYLAGRLRVKWTQVHSDEVYFRDTAHGFLTWAIASLLTAAIFSSATTAIATGTAKAGAAAITASAAVVTPAVAGAANAADEGKNQNGVLDYYVDNLFRSQPVANSQAGSEQSTNVAAKPPLDARDRAEVLRIFQHSLVNGALSPADKSYLAQIIAEQTGMSAAEADARVNAVYDETRNAIEQAKTKAQEAIDKARKAAAYSALWMFVALLCGAFVASLAATWGGNQRDSLREIVS